MCQDKIGWNNFQRISILIVMIIKINKSNFGNISSELEYYRNARNKKSEYIFKSEWSRSTLARLERGVIKGLYHCDGNICRGFLLYQVGKRSVFVSSIYIRPGEEQNEALNDLVRYLRDIYSNKVILITNPAPGMVVRAQSDIFIGAGFDKMDRYRMDYHGGELSPKVPKPSGVKLRKFRPEFESELNELDRRAYKDHPDEVLMDVFSDILGEYPSLRLAKAGNTFFDSKLSNFAFIDEKLIGAIYCASGRNMLGIANIAIDPKYQKIGVGALLLDRTLRGLKKSLYNGCTLHVSRENVVAYKFYKKIGFKLKRFCPNFVYRLGQGVNTS